MSDEGRGTMEDGGRMTEVGSQRSGVKGQRLKAMRLGRCEGMRLEVEKQGDNGMREIKAIGKMSVSL
jgi:hypothetical protein